MGCILFFSRWYFCRVRSFQVMSLQAADLFRFYVSILADKMQCSFHVTSCIQFDFSRVQLQYRTVLYLFFASDTNCYQKSISQKNVQFKHAVSVKYGCLNTPLGIACTCLNTCTHNLRARTFTGMLACTLTCSPARSHVHSPACFRLRVFKVIFGSKYRL